VRAEQVPLRSILIIPYSVALAEEMSGRFCATSMCQLALFVNAADLAGLPSVMNYFSSNE
jgi:hypothetical protein